MFDWSTEIETQKQRNSKKENLVKLDNLSEKIYLNSLERNPINKQLSSNFHEKSRKK